MLPISRADLAIVLTAGMSDDEAYAHLRREAMRRRVAVEDYAQSLVRTRGGEPPDAMGNNLEQEASNG